MSDIVERLHAHAVVGERQIADRFSEEDFEADGVGRGHGQNIFRVGLHNDAGDAEIDERLCLSQLLFDLYLLGICGRRHRVGHVDDAGNAAADGRGGTRGEVFLVGHAGLSEVNVPVNNSREDVFTFGVDFLFALGQLIV